MTLDLDGPHFQLIFNQRFCLPGHLRHYAYTLGGLRVPALSTPVMGMLHTRGGKYLHSKFQLPTELEYCGPESENGTSSQLK